jgi:hypothetical protein
VGRARDGKRVDMIKAWYMYVWNLLICTINGCW